MAERETKAKAKSSEREEETEPLPQGRSTSAVAEVDDLLDEIDSVLEANAEEFVKAYVQKGGQ